MEDRIVEFETGVLAKSKGIYVTNSFTSSGASTENIVQFYEKSKQLITIENYSIDCCTPEPEEEYKGEIPCPTQSLLQKILRDTYDINIWIVPGKMGGWKYFISSRDGDYIDGLTHAKYEEALEDALKYALTLIKFKINEKAK